LHDIVYLSRVPWDSLYQRPQHLAMGLARNWRVLFVDTPRSTFYRRVLKPLRAHEPVRPFLWQPAPGLTVLSPAYVPFLPGWWPPPGQYILSRIFLSWAVRRMGMSSPIVWAQDPRDLYFLPPLAPRLVCYDCMDDYALIAPSASGRPELRAQEIALLRRADLVFASSTDLAKRCAESNPHVVLVPNGVDAAHFSPVPVAADAAAIPSPRIGYVGSLATWVDWALLAAVARAHPDWSLVLVGPAAGEAEDDVVALRRIPNVHVLGERPYAAISSYLHAFDVCLIPFRLNDLTRTVNPVKFFEYMAAGKPVVATALPELAPYAGVCTLADGAADFVAGIAAALAEGNNPARVQQRLSVAQANSWTQRVQTIQDALAAALHARI
jgi:glycosyltransferase involved in cell wall biosynthesis